MSNRLPPEDENKPHIYITYVPSMTEMTRDPDGTYRPRMDGEPETNLHLMYSLTFIRISESADGEFFYR